MISLRHDWLHNALMSRNPRQGGLGTRPEYYSGRGAIRNDLPPSALDALYDTIEKNAGQDAAQAFAQMVADIPVLSATEFLLNLERLDRADFKWSKSILGNDGGVHATDEASAFATVACLFGGGGNRDETSEIRGMFLARHGIKDPTPAAR
jgi:hypothetical protein